jgi:hypothetical protein
MPFSLCFPESGVCYSGRPVFLSEILVESSTYCSCGTMGVMKEKVVIFCLWWVFEDENILQSLQTVAGEEKTNI